MELESGQKRFNDFDREGKGKVLKDVMMKEDSE